MIGDRRPSCRVVALAVGVVLVLSVGCRALFGKRGSATPPEPETEQAAECRPLEIDGATSQLWAEALHGFIVRQRVAKGCVLVRRDECHQDPPASVLEKLRAREPRLASWDFLCGEGVTILTLRDDADTGDRIISVGDGFKVTCRWTIRRRWFPWQGRLASEGCFAATSDHARD